MGTVVPTAWLQYGYSIAYSSPYSMGTAVPIVLATAWVQYRDSMGTAVPTALATAWV